MKIEMFLVSAAGNRVLYLDGRGHPETPESVAYLTLNQYPSLLRDTQADLLTVISYQIDGMMTLDFWNPDGSREHLCGNSLRGLAAIDAVRPSLEHADPFAIAICGTLHYSFRMSSQSCGWISPQSFPKVVTLVENAEYLVDVGTLHRVLLSDSRTSEADDDDRLFSCSSPMPCSVSVVRLLESGRVGMRIIERGVGETRSCGSGALSAFLVLQARRGAGSVVAPHQSEVTVEFRSGESLVVSLDEGRNTYRVCGPAEFIESRTLNL
jgi:diaminopimelate epimerase